MAIQSPRETIACSSRASATWPALYRAMTLTQDLRETLAGPPITPSPPTIRIQPLRRFSWKRCTKVPHATVYLDCPGIEGAKHRVAYFSNSQTKRLFNSITTIFLFHVD